MVEESYEQLELHTLTLMRYCLSDLNPPIPSCLHKKRYQALPAFPYCKLQKAGWGLGRRLGWCLCSFSALREGYQGGGREL